MDNDLFGRSWKTSQCCVFLPLQVCGFSASAGLHGRSLWKSLQRSQFRPSVLCLHTHRPWIWTIRKEQQNYFNLKKDDRYCFLNQRVKILLKPFFTDSSSPPCHSPGLPPLGPEHTLRHVHNRSSFLWPPAHRWHNSIFAEHQSAGPEGHLPECWAWWSWYVSLWYAAALWRKKMISVFSNFMTSIFPLTEATMRINPVDTVWQMTI